MEGRSLETFQIAVIQGDVEKARKFEGDPAECDPTDSMMTCFHYASQNNDVPMLRYLVHSRSNPATCFLVRNKRGNNVVHQASLSASFAALEFLLSFEDHRKCIDDTNVWEETPLHLAAQSGDKKCLDLLKQAGADASKKDKWGRTAEEVFADHFAGKKDKQMPLAVSKKKTKVLSKTIEFPLDEERFLKLLDDEETDIFSKDTFGLSVLHKLSAWNCDRLLMHVLGMLEEEKGSFLNEIDGEGNTCLHHAAMMGAMRTYEILLKEDQMKKETKNKQGKTALNYLE